MRVAAAAASDGSLPERDNGAEGGGAGAELRAGVPGGDGGAEDGGVLLGYLTFRGGVWVTGGISIYVG